MILVDTNVFIDFARGYNPAKDFIFDTRNQLATSVVCLMEYIRGTAKLTEAEKFEKFLVNRSVTIIHIDEAISIKAYEIYKRWYHKVKLSYMDAIVLATAYTKKVRLFTRDVKHFSFYAGVKLICPYN